MSLITSCEEEKEGIDCSLHYGTLVDPRDGSRYSTVAICDAVWMTQNIRYEVPGALKGPIDLGVEYGLLYNYEQAQIACPENWHLSTDKDWQTLETILGMSKEELEGTGWRGETIGQKLKSSTQWNKGAKSEKKSTPLSFRALPAGYSDGTEQGLEKKARFWTASEVDAETAWIRALGIDETKIKRSTEKKTDYNSCRCVLD
ncbi:MAG: Unknown protein [uncultured Aureispira sp.]|uniref:Fibrobacter succinogenes major paralogous domain-containing protein n=1 Tax=uncultured Aureispira sp. TaxID=1331704 RepID=A0A6S6UL03_9BACT|nr:MAG: Unknown protein [uncultured Aureispira sp.]